MFSRATAKKWAMRAATLIALQSSPSSSFRLPDIPTSFVAFCTDVLGVRLTPGQTVIAKVAYDGMEPRDLEPGEREIARAIFGDVDEVPVLARAVLVAVCGGRGGKSYVLIALRLVHGMFVRDLSSLAPGQRAKALVIAPDEALRQEVVDYALGALQDSPLASALLLPRGYKQGDRVKSFSVRRADGRIVEFLAGVSVRGGYGGRGKSLTDFAMDESAFFRDKSAQVNDEDIYAAASARVLPGGQSIVASTPWAQAGLLFKFWERNFGHPIDALVAHAPTTVLNDSAAIAQMVERETLRDPDNADREFGAQFLAAGTTIFFEGDTLHAANVNASPVRSPAQLQPGDKVTAGGDLGMRRNSSALAIVVTRGSMSWLAELFESKPERGKALVPSTVVKSFAERMLAWGVRVCMADGHYRETMVEYLTAAKLVYVPAPASPDEAFVATRNRLREGTLGGLDNEELRQQMRETQGIPLPGGRLRIALPHWANGAHGDLLSALVLAVYQASPTTVKAPPPTKGSPEWEAKEREERRQRVRDANSSRPTDRGRNAHWRKTG